VLSSGVMLLHLLDRSVLFLQHLLRQQWWWFRSLVVFWTWEDEEMSEFSKTNRSQGAQSEGVSLESSNWANQTKTGTVL
jgi:hypothetical protein